MRLISGKRASYTTMLVGPRVCGSNRALPTHHDKKLLNKWSSLVVRSLHTIYVLAAGDRQEPTAPTSSPLTTSLNIITSSFNLFDPVSTLSIQRSSSNPHEPHLCSKTSRSQRISYYASTIHPGTPCQNLIYPRPCPRRPYGTLLNPRCLVHQKRFPWVDLKSLLVHIVNASGP